MQKPAAFTTGVTSDQLSIPPGCTSRSRVLDALGCAVGALSSPIASQLRAHTEGIEGRCTLTGGGRSAPDRAPFFNSALVRYVDFNDSYRPPGGTRHPSDNLGPVLPLAITPAVPDFLTALAVAYQVQCRLSDLAPLRAKGSII